MSGINFICKSTDENEIPQKILESKKFSFPLVHTSSESIARLSKEIKNYKKDNICTLPFCSTVEVEALGGKVNLGDERIGPRVNSFLYENIEELKSIKEINFNDGRIKEVLDAIEKLSKEGETVALNVSGPFMIATSLVDPMIFYKAIRKDTEIVKEILKVIEDSIIKYIKEALKKGVKIISFGDSVGSVDIVGPRVYKDISGEATFSILKRIVQLKEFNNSIVHLCGKTSVSLEKYGFITSEPVKIEEDTTYGQVIINIANRREDIKIIGHSCMKRTPIKLKYAKVWKVEFIESNKVNLS